MRSERPERPDLRPERPDLRPERPDLRPERPDRGGDGQTDERKSPCVQQDFVPFGAAAQKEGKKKEKKRKQQFPFFAAIVVCLVLHNSLLQSISSVHILCQLTIQYLVNPLGTRFAAQRCLVSLRCGFAHVQSFMW